jgi:hypothetical protein
VSLISAQRDADMKLEKIDDAERRLFESERYARKLKGELMAAQQDREQLVKVMNKSEDIQKELNSRIADRQAASLRADLLGQKAGPITQMWLREMEDLDEQLASLPGDSAIAACLAVYGGPMHSSERNSVVEVWRECVEKAGLPVSSSSFNLDTFLWRRHRQVRWQDLPVHGLFLLMCFPLTLQLTEGMNDHSLAAMRSSGWLESLFLASLAPRPPLIIDDCQEALDLIQEMNQGKHITCHLDIRESDVVAKAARATRDGSTVIVQIHNPGSSHEGSVMSAVAFACRRSLEMTEADQYGVLSDHQAIGHRLYFISLSLGTGDDNECHYCTMLSPDLLRIVSPILFSYERKETMYSSLSQSPLLCLTNDLIEPYPASSQFSRKLVDVVIQNMLGIDAVAEIREAKTNAWEALRNAEEIK